MATETAPPITAALVCAAHSVCTDIPSFAALVAVGYPKENVCPYELLMAWTLEPKEVCQAAVTRARQEGLVEGDTLTAQGQAIFEQSGLNPRTLSLPAIKRHGEEFKKAFMDAASNMSPEAQQKLAENLAEEKDGRTPKSRTP